METKILNRSWSDETWGKDGKELLIVKLLHPILPIVLALLIYTLVVEEYTGYWHVAIVLIVVALYVFDRCIFSIVAIHRVKTQIVNVTHKNEFLMVQCYFGVEQEVLSTELSSIEKTDFGYWYLRYSYLSNDESNYCLTTTNGNKFYISGDMPEVGSLIATLQEIIESNRNP